MHPDAFAAARGPAWDELAGFIAAARGRARRLPAGDILRLGARYREDGRRPRLRPPAVRRRPRDAPPRDAGRARATTRLRRPRTPGIARRVPPPRLLARRRRAAEAAHRRLAAVARAEHPGGALWALNDPGAAGGLVPARPPQRLGVAALGLVLHGAGEHAGVSIGIFVNNIQVTFLAYAGGMTLGLLTGYVLASNGILLGGGRGPRDRGGERRRPAAAGWSAHGVLELSCIAVAAAAGLRVGWSLVEPGAGTRTGALRAEAGALGRHRARHDAVARPRRARRGLRDGDVRGSRWSCRSGFALGALYWGSFSARPRAFARAYAPTQAPAKRSGRASMTVAPAAATREPRARARAASRARPSSRRRRAARPGGRASSPSSAASRTLATHTSCRRASTGTAIDQGARGGLVDEVREHEHEAPLAACHAAKRELVVAVAIDGLDVEERARDGLGSHARGATSRSTRSAKASAPLRSPSASAVAQTAMRPSSATSSSVPPPQAAALRRPASSRQRTSLSWSMRYWLDIGRPSLAVARQLIWRTSSSGAYSRTASKAVPRPKASARTAPGLRQAAATGSEREAARSDEIGIDEQLRVATQPVIPRAEPERPGSPYAHGRQHVTARAAARRARLRARPRPPGARASTSAGSACRTRTGVGAH